MNIKSYFGLCLWLTLTVAAGGCCLLPPPPPPVGVTLKPGRYLEEFYSAPGFDPTQTPCHLGPFTVEVAQGVEADTFLSLFQAELERAWEANALKTAPPTGACRLTGTIRLVSVTGTHSRFVLGRLCAQLSVSGTITREGQTLFAFRDRLSLESPVNPGPRAPRETELLLRQLCRAWAHHLLDEMLL